MPEFYDPDWGALQSDKPFQIYRNVGSAETPCWMLDRGYDRKKWAFARYNLLAEEGYEVMLMFEGRVLPDGEL